MPAAPPLDDAQRIDIWLWRARFFKSRSLSAKAASAGSIRVVRNGASVRVEKPSTLVRPGDRLSFPGSNGAIRVIEVKACGSRRGPASEAVTLFVEEAQAPSATPTIDQRGGGRPTKKDRRAIDRLQGRA